MTYHNKLHARLTTLIADMASVHKSQEEFDYSVVIDQLSDALITMEDLRAFDVDDYLAAQEQLRNEAKSLNYGAVTSA